MKDKFTPIRIGQIEARWTQSMPEIALWYPNHHYGKLNEYLAEGFEKRGEVIYKDSYGIGLSCFKNPESCYVVAFLELDIDESSVDLRSVGNRILQLEEKDLVDFLEVYRQADKTLIELLEGV